MLIKALFYVFYLPLSQIPVVGLVDGTVCSKGDTTKGLSITTSNISTTPSSLPPLSSLTISHSDPPSLSPSTPPVPPTDCCDEWVHIELSPTNPSTAVDLCCDRICLTLKHIEKVHKE